MTFTQDTLVTILFCLSYFTMAWGHLPVLRWSRSTTAGFAALIVLLLFSVPAVQIIPALHIPTLVILFSLMLISAIFYLSGFYDYCAMKIAKTNASFKWILALVVVVAGVLSAFLANDVIAFAMAPVLCDGLKHRGMDPRPFLFALMAACNAGSAATMIGNPQNILIAEHAHLSFWKFFLICAPIAVVSLLIVFFVTHYVWRKSLLKPYQISQDHLPVLNKRQFYWGLFFVLLLLVAFTSKLPRVDTALFIALLVLLTQAKFVGDLLKNIDWRLLLLLAALFIVNQAFENTGVAQMLIQHLLQLGFNLDHPLTLAIVSLLSSNAIGNVPAVIMLLSLWPHWPPHSFYALSLMMTLSGNALLLGSLANIIVAERAKQHGQVLHFYDHLRAGLPIALLSVAVACIYFLR